MNDLISRQAAIDALDFEIVHMTAYCDGKNEGNPLAQYNKGLEDGKKAIEALPSAQPDIIRCKDCRFATLTYDGDCKYCQYLEGEFGLTDAVYFDGNDYCSHAERRTNE